MRLEKKRQIKVEITLSSLRASYHNIVPWPMATCQSGTLQICRLWNVIHETTGDHLREALFATHIKPAAQQTCPLFPCCLVRTYICRSELLFLGFVDGSGGLPGGFFFFELGEGGLPVDKSRTCGCSMCRFIQTTHSITRVEMEDLRIKKAVYSGLMNIIERHALSLPSSRQPVNSTYPQRHRKWKEGVRKTLEIQITYSRTNTLVRRLPQQASEE